MIIWEFTKMSELCNRIYLKTGNPNLNQILSMDAGSDSWGIECRVGDEENRNTPVVLILGSAGTGKTTLALQIASAVASDPSRPGVFFYSLEQSTASLTSAHKEFKFAQLMNDGCPFIDLATYESDNMVSCKIHLCHFASLPILVQEAAGAFDDRFRQLCHMIANVESRRTIDKRGHSVFFLDSLNAIANSVLNRSDIYRLFAVFRAQGIPVIITAERPESSSSASAAVTESARFLADIVIELTKDSSTGHLLQYMEITKSRVRRQALGRHLYKIRVPKNEGAETSTSSQGGSGQEGHGGTESLEGLPASSLGGGLGNEGQDEGLRENSGGVVVYPSIPCVISMLKSPRSGLKVPRERKVDFGVPVSVKPAWGLRGLLGGEKLKSASRIAVLGPYGTHKLALAMNIAAGLPADLDNLKGPKLLIISFGGYDPIALSKVAWLEEGKRWANCRPPKSEPSPKWWKTPFHYSEDEVSDEQLQKLPLCALQLSFRLGHVTPEECFHEINELIKQSANSTLRSILLSDTGQICAGFPLLRREPLFLPTLLDLFHEHSLLSVSIGVDSGTEINKEMDFALQSCSDIRIYHSHDKSVKELVRDDPERTGQEQRVCVVVDNVSGKEYKREPNWLGVKDGAKQSKELFCGPLKELGDWRKVLPR